MGVRDLIDNEQYKEALADLDYSFLVKVYLRILLTNNSDERPDFIQAKKLYNQLFLNSPDVAAELNETLELSIDLDNCELELVFGIINKFFETRNKNAMIATRLNTLVCDTPDPEETNRKVSKTSKAIHPSSSHKNLPDENHYHPLQPLKLDQKFSHCTPKPTQKSQIGRSKAEILPASTTMKAQIFHSNKKIIRWRAHDRPATKACMLRHYGHYYCDRWNHECGEVEQIDQQMYIEKEGVALREVQDVIVNGQLRKEKRGKRVKRDVVKVDQIYFDILAGVKEVQGEIKYARDGKGSDLVSDLLAKIKNWWNDLKWINNEVEIEYENNNSYGVQKLNEEYEMIEGRFLWS